jgi:hypothetical protein
MEVAANAGPKAGSYATTQPPESALLFSLSHYEAGLVSLKTKRLTSIHSQ